MSSPYGNEMEDGESVAQDAFDERTAAVGQGMGEPDAAADAEGGGEQGDPEGAAVDGATGPEGHDGEDAAVDGASGPAAGADGGRRVKHGGPKVLTQAILFGIVSGLVAAVIAAAAYTLAGGGLTLAGSSGPNDVTQVAREVTPTVYSIYPADGSPNSDRIGSAVAYRKDGYLITNFHVVGDTGTVTLTDSDGDTFDGEVVGGHERTDISVVRVDRTLRVPLWSTRQVEVGEAAIAVGSPFGFAGSVSSGIISAVDRSAGMVNGSALYGMLQTDAAINPGNSGGALADASGAIIGVNTAIYSSNGQAQGVGFAIPTETVIQVADRIISEGTFESGFIGVMALDAVGAAGAHVESVLPDFPAADAGLEKGDLIISVDGQPVRDVAELAGRVSRIVVGTEVTVIAIRDGEELTFTVTLAATPDQETIDAIETPEVDDMFDESTEDMFDESTEDMFDESTEDR